MMGSFNSLFVPFWLFFFGDVPWRGVCLYMYVQFLLHVQAIAFTCTIKRHGVPRVRPRSRFRGDFYYIHTSSGTPGWMCRLMSVSLPFEAGGKGCLCYLSIFFPPTMLMPRCSFWMRWPARLKMAAPSNSSFFILNSSFIEVASSSKMKVKPLTGAVPVISR